MTRLTIKRLEAIAEALAARLAGEIDIEADSDVKRKDYELALDWAFEQRAKREHKDGD